jgi:hypothetical protein
VAHYIPQPAEDSLMLQDHNSDPVRYRNIWIRRLKGYDQPEKYVGVIRPPWRA